MDTWTPPEHFKGKWWRCWLCGGDLTQGERTTYIEGILFTDPESPSCPARGPVFVHSKCHRDAIEHNSQCVKQFFDF